MRNDPAAGSLSAANSGASYDCPPGVRKTLTSRSFEAIPRWARCPVRNLEIPGSGA